MPVLTFREQLFIVAVLAVVLLGVVIKHWRDARREGLPVHAAASLVPAARR